MGGQEGTTESPELIRRLGQFDIDDIIVVVANHPELRFYIPERWWVVERFDIHAFDEQQQRFVGMHLEVDVGKGTVKDWSNRANHSLKSVAVSIELLQFAKEVLLAAR